MVASSKALPPLSRRRTWLFAAITVAVSTVVALVAAEVVLGLLRRDIETSNRIDEGMFDYHPRIGWLLEPGWRGRHRHHDFDVTYTVNAQGFRGTPAPVPAPPGQQRIAWLGDSYTFAMGVDDADTFTEVLNRWAAPDRLHLNFGVPGYSTDQAVLLAEERVLLYEPDVVVLVVYLGNDLIDNTAPYPLQVGFAKPYFELTAGGDLALRNVPVPRAPKPPALAGRTFGRVVLGDRVPEPGLLARSDILRRLGYRPAAADISDSLGERFAPSVALFAALIDRLHRRVDAHGAELVVMLLPGMSYVVDPGSYSAQYQAFARRAVLATLADAGIPAIDAATALREAHQAGRRDLYHPNERHLTPTGNTLLADLVAEFFPRSVSPRLVPGA